MECDKNNCPTKGTYIGIHEIHFRETNSLNERFSNSGRFEVSSNSGYRMSIEEKIHQNILYNVFQCATLDGFHFCNKLHILRICIHCFHHLTHVHASHFDLQIFASIAERIWNVILTTICIAVTPIINKFV